MEIRELLQLTVKRSASDLHLIVGYPPTLRIDGKILPQKEFPILDQKLIEMLVLSVLSPEQKELLLANKELDYSLEMPFGRFRVNAYHQKGSLAASFRLIPLTIKTIEELNLPDIFHLFAKVHQGFVLVTGPTGHGKSTTLASILNEINNERTCHIVTIEDPIEYVYPKGKAIVSQREMHGDTHSWDIALRSVLREDPDVVLVGEMRDLETVAAALTIAETGHLVFATLHTNSAAQTIDRIVDVFPPHQQAQVRLQLAATLEGIICQKLIPLKDGGRIPACETLLATQALRSTIREGKTHLIDNIIQTSGGAGMVLFESYLVDLMRQGKISLEIAQEYAMRPEELIRLLKRKY